MCQWTYSIEEGSASEEKLITVKETTEELIEDQTDEGKKFNNFENELTEML